MFLNSVLRVEMQYMCMHTVELYVVWLIFLSFMK